MAISNDQVDVTSEVVKIVHDDTDGCQAVVVNIGKNSVYLGNESVTVNNGLELTKTSRIDLDLGPTEEIYGVCNSGESTTVAYLLTKNNN